MTTQSQGNLSPDANNHLLEEAEENSRTHLPSEEQQQDHLPSNFHEFCEDWSKYLRERAADYKRLTALREQRQKRQ